MRWRCLLGLHVWGGNTDAPVTGAWRCCAACDKYQEGRGRLDGILPHWVTLPLPKDGA